MFKSWKCFVSLLLLTAAVEASAEDELLPGLGRTLRQLFATKVDELAGADLAGQLRAVQMVRNIMQKLTEEDPGVDVGGGGGGGEGDDDHDAVGDDWRRETLAEKLLRLAGWDSQALGDLSLDVLVYLADLAVRKNLLQQEDDEAGDQISEYRSIVRQDGLLSGMTRLVRDSRPRAAKVREALGSKTLPDDIIAGLKRRQEQGGGGDGSRDTECVQLFLCKMSPLVWGLQDTVKERPLDFGRSLSGNFRAWSNSLVDRIPDLDGVAKYGREECEDRFPGCKLVDFEKMGLGGERN